MKNKLYIVSNRLPLSIEQSGNGYISRPSSGGLISAMSAYLDGEGKEKYYERIWAGVPDCSAAVWNGINNKADNYSYLPVFVNGKSYEHYYNGFSNSILWPLFHYFPSYVDYKPSYFEAYKQVNQQFADALSSKLKNEDVVWIHDYHLLPLAAMLRQKFPSITIGFFLHVPFPAYELFRVMPKQWQREILTGLLGADLIGFHTEDYVAHFSDCVEMVLKVKPDGHYIPWNNRQVKAAAFPISVDYDLFNNAYDDTEVVKERQRYLSLKGDKKLIFSVDRLDYTKGIYNRLKGYKEFLIKNPQYQGKVVFALVVVPSRDTINKYAERKKMIDEFIGNFNSRLGTIHWQPVIYQYGHLDFNELVALYTACDLALITPLRDGMNLVSKEFVASRKDKQGVLILSEMAGAARELTEALLINPNDTREIAAMIKQGIEMDAAEQEDRIADMQRRVSRYNVNTWAADYLGQLKQSQDLQHRYDVKFLDDFAKAKLLSKYAKAGKRLLLLDYDGTLVPFTNEPANASPSPAIIETLDQLANDPQNEVFIVSGRDSNSLEKWLGNLPVGLIAEHGAKVRHTGSKWVLDTSSDLKAEMKKVESIMESYVARCPNSFIEKKDHSLAWHYRKADPFQASLRAKELYAELMDYTALVPLNVLNGHKVIEVKNQRINKGVAIQKLINSNTYDFILCIGDDATDEDMFKRLANLPQATSIKVGTDVSIADYNVHTPYLVQSLLQSVSLYPNPAASRHTLTV